MTPKVCDRITRSCVDPWHKQLTYHHYIQYWAECNLGCQRYKLLWKHSSLQQTPHKLVLSHESLRTC